MGSWVGAIILRLHFFSLAFEVSLSNFVSQELRDSSQRLFNGFSTNDRIPSELEQPLEGSIPESVACVCVLRWGWGWGWVWERNSHLSDIRLVSNTRPGKSRAPKARAARGVWGHAPPENFEIQRFRTALLSVFRGIFLQKSQSLSRLEFQFFLLSDTGATMLYYKNKLNPREQPTFMAFILQIDVFQL